MAKYHTCQCDICRTIQLGPAEKSDPASRIFFFLRVGGHRGQYSSKQFQPLTL